MILIAVVIIIVIVVIFILYIIIYKLIEIEEKGFNVQLTIIDTPGFGDYVNNSDCWVPIVEFIDEQHLNYMKQERKANRRNIDDMRVHACLYFIQPTGHTYD